jgi:hypothetical protein
VADILRADVSTAFDEKLYSLAVIASGDLSMEVWSDAGFVQRGGLISSEIQRVSGDSVMRCTGGVNG